MAKICLLDFWLLTFLGALLACSYGSAVVPVEYRWIHWPVTIALGSALLSAVATEMAARGTLTRDAVQGMRRATLYVSALILGLPLDYAITPERIGSRSFRLGIFAMFGLPLFVWLFHHIWRHHRNRASAGRDISLVTLAVCSLVLLALYSIAVALSPTE